MALSASFQGRPLALFAATYVAVVMIFAGVTAWTDHADLRAAKLEEASRLAVLIAERFERSATAADIILRDVQTQAEEILASGRLLSDLPWAGFRSAADVLPDPGSLWVVDEHGALQRASTTPDTPEHNFKDREYFPHHEAGTARYLSSAVKGRLTGQYHWLVSRRINGPDGHFAGVVLAAMEDSGLATIHQSMNLGPGAVLSVRRADGALVMRQPADDAMIASPSEEGRRISTLLEGSARSGRYVGPMRDGGEDYLVAWRRTDRHNMVAIVRVPISLLWHLWKPQATIYAALMLASLVPLLFLMRIGKRTAAAEAEARASLERLTLHQRQLLRDQETVVVRQRLFLDTVSHEFRTPLAIIDSTVQVLQRQNPAQDAATAGRFDKIRRATRRLTDLLDTCLAEDRLGGTGASLKLAPTDLRRLLNDLAREWTRMDLRPGPPAVVDADAPLLGIALHNIVENALKYSPPDSPVTVAVTQLLRETTISVTDRGPGISPQDLPHIFEKFYRSQEPQENKPGLGLGLNIAKKIVEQHGGRIEVQPGSGADSGADAGRGTTFLVILPAPTMAGGTIKSEKAGTP
ncbi:ATP-binding protein [Novispirillum sp. DQ9]|uniref:sensor histidine kinase n=1 Tax=Novispirillum sp. DQ9 TaxID=3398612 RepID=UPI003C7DB8CA